MLTAMFYPDSWSRQAAEMPLLFVSVDGHFREDTGMEQVYQVSWPQL